MTDLAAPSSEPPPRGSEPPPWYVALLHGLGGLIAGFLLLSFLTETVLDDPEDLTFGFTGCLLIAAAAVIARFQSHPFLRLFALSLSLAGYAAFCVYLLKNFDLGTLAATLVLVTAGLYALYRDALHRFFSVLLMLIVLAYWVLEEGGIPADAVHGLLLLAAAATIWAFGTTAAPRAARAGGYAAMIFLLGLPHLVLFPDVDREIVWWPARIVGAGFALAVLWQIHRAYRAFQGAWLAAATIGVAAVGAATTPGLAFAIGLLALGFWRSERILTALGLLFVPVFIVVFYYDLQLTLLDKSLMLMAGGAALLALRQGLVHWARRRRLAEEAA